MRYLIISDIHSNLEALEKVLKLASEKNYDEIICLGDIVGYGANPNECCEVIKEEAKYTVMGNHDYALLNLNERIYLNEYARRAIEWTEKEIREENKKFLQSLDLKKKIKNDVLITHTAPSDPLTWEYIFSLEEAIMEFQKTEERVIFFGHTHIPVVFKEKKEGNDIKYTLMDIYYVEKEPPSIHIKLEENCRYLVNPGSVGQPRDGDPRASFLIYDDELEYLSFYRVEYDIDKVRNEIIKNGLPQFLGDRLYFGR